MTALEAAARRGDWDRVAVCLLAGLLRTLEALPAEALSELLDLLAEDGEAGGRDGS
jgi:hypothetical protein